MSTRFSWEHFSPWFIKGIVYSERTVRKNRPNFETDDMDLLLPYMARIAADPNPQFVKRYRNEILDYFFAGSVHLVNVTRKLKKINYRDIEDGSMEEMLFNLKKLRMSPTVMKLFIHELRSKGRRLELGTETSIFTWPVPIDLEDSIPHETSLFNYQKEAVSALKKFYVDEDKRAGFLVMPTGSGKTRVAAYFLIKEMISQGYQVVWLTHRSMLIEQAADAFYSSSTLSKLVDPGRKTFKIACVSGEHATVRALDPDHDVMVLGVQSISRNTDYLKAVLGGKVIVVIDEAHHAIAPSYRRSFDAIKEVCPSVKLLGLTATPVRISAEGTDRLMSHFDGQVIFSKAMSDLILDGTLATPQYMPIQTNMDFETNITLDEQAYMKKWGELSPSLVDKIANTNERNELIVNTYLKHKEEFGKTLIFALNAIHCISLCEKFQEEGIRCDYIYCAHPGNPEKIERFKKKGKQEDALDVLVNINVLTEGSDVPDIQTVFLTRPTTSDVLLMQMIGRGMRGEQFGGTKTVNIVDFCDKWTSFTRWLNPQFFFDDISQPPIPEPEYLPRDVNLIPWDMIRDIINGIHTRMIGEVVSQAALPVGWYDVIDQDGNDTRVLVFEDQLAGYKRLFTAKKEILDDLTINGPVALDKYFGGFGLLPSVDDLQLVLDMTRADRLIPSLRQFSERKWVDASIIGQRLKEQDARIAEIETEIQSLYNAHKELVESIYGSFESYKERVYDFIKYPHGITPPGARIAEIEMEFYPLDREPFYNLKELFVEVIEEMFEAQMDNLPSLTWTDRCYESYFGVYYHEIQNIRINRILNSKDIPREVIKYILYHEMLHHVYPDNGHDKFFRSEERKYPDYVVQERFLATTFPKFQIKYAI